MASIIFSKDAELIEELKQENKRFIKKATELGKSDSRVSHGLVYMRMVSFIGDEIQKLVHEVDDEKLKALIDEGAECDG